MALIVCGHPRSGTTLLFRLFNRHPEIALTMEFGNFALVGRRFPLYRRGILKRWWKRKSANLTHPLTSVRLRKAYRSNLFVARYLFHMHLHRRRRVDVAAIEATLKAIFPGASIVGDKYPGYVFSLDKLSQAEGLQCLVIYRDGRDVARSALEQARTDWKGKGFAGRFDTAGKVAGEWVRAIESMERNAERIHAVRYESLVANPAEELESIGAWLGVDPGGFPAGMIQGTSVGKHREGLSERELAEVLEVADPAMRRLGYL